MTEADIIPYIRTTEVAPVRLGELMGIWKDAQNVRYSNRARFSPAPTRILALDAVLNLYFPFFLVVVARNKAGKTALMLSVALALAQAGYVVLWDALEMGLYQMCSRIAANLAGVDMDTFEKFKATPDDWYRFDSALERLLDQHFYIDTGLNRIPLIDRFVNWGRESFPGTRKVLVVDYSNLVQVTSAHSIRESYIIQSSYYAQLMHPGGKGELSVDELLNLTNASDVVACMTASQVPAEYKRDKEKRIDINSTTESSVWGNDCTHWIAINKIPDERKGSLPGSVELDLGGRYGREATVEVHFNRAQARYEDVREPAATPPLI
jgi:hypothetical protein